MSAIRLNGTSSGYTELAPPAAAGSNTITLPSSNGSANQFLKNGSTAGTLGWSSMVETATGVGIGTTSPGQKLVVSQNGAQGLELNPDSATAFILAGYNRSTSQYINLDYQADNHIFRNGTSERARITSDGHLLIGQSANIAPGVGNTQLGVSFENTDGGSSRALWVSRGAGVVIGANRNTNDGTIVSLRQDGTEEGNISVSGTTISYNGAHLSRWSQVPGIDPHDKDARPEILRGTVMSNLDEMCDWIDPDSGEAQANEQLNKTKISDVEGDKNVAGVFQSWDDDDDTWVNDFYLAMTGDFVIRIAEGVTVERGDLLISAGDGTAKPQDDDLIRSSTVAKVTSTTVSHVHPDGSFCVPCVLMAC